jgi:hypothetical protein
LPPRLAPRCLFLFTTTDRIPMTLWISYSPLRNNSSNRHAKSAPVMRAQPFEVGA